MSLAPPTLLTIDSDLCWGGIQTHWVKGADGESLCWPFGLCFCSIFNWKKSRSRGNRKMHGWARPWSLRALPAGADILRILNNHLPQLSQEEGLADTLQLSSGLPAPRALGSHAQGESLILAWPGSTMLPPLPSRVVPIPPHLQPREPGPQPSGANLNSLGKQN